MGLLASLTVGGVLLRAGVNKSVTWRNPSHCRRKRSEVSRWGWGGAEERKEKSENPEESKEQVKEAEGVR